MGKARIKGTLKPARFPGPQCADDAHPGGAWVCIKPEAGRMEAIRGGKVGLHPVLLRVGACKIFGWARSGGHKIRLQQGRWFHAIMWRCPRWPPQKCHQWPRCKACGHHTFPLCFLPLVKWLDAPAPASALLYFTLLYSALLRLALRGFCLLASFLPFELPCSPSWTSPCRVRWWVTTKPKRKPQKKSLRSTQVKSLLVAPHHLLGLLDLRGGKRVAT